MKPRAWSASKYTSMEATYCLGGIHQLRTSRHFIPKEQYCSRVSKEAECRQTLTDTTLLLTLDHFSTKMFLGKEKG